MAGPTVLRLGLLAAEYRLGLNLRLSVPRRKLRSFSGLTSESEFVKPWFSIDFMDERRLGKVDACADSEERGLLGSISVAENDRFREGER